MENAAKALVIAGGILLAIMTLSLLIYMFGSTTRMAQAQDEKKAVEQLAAFNNEYEAFNKSVMYGVDVITVVNKAIVHNDKMLASIETDPYYINIKINLLQQFKTTVDELDTRQEYPTPVTLRDSQITSQIKGYLETSNVFGTYLEVGENKLGDFTSNGRIVMNKNFIKFFEGDTEDKTVNVPSQQKTYKMYSALTNFKRAIFQCQAANDNDNNGRIDEMIFVQLEVEDY